GEVPARSGGGCSQGIGLYLSPSCIRGRCDRGPVALRSARRPGAQRLRLFARDRIKPVAFVYPWALRPGTGRAPSRSVGTGSVGTSFERRVVSVFHVSMDEKIIDAPQHKQSPAEPQRDLVQFAFHQGFVLTGFD